MNITFIETCECSRSRVNTPYLVRSFVDYIYIYIIDLIFFSYLKINSYGKEEEKEKKTNIFIFMHVYVTPINPINFDITIDV